MIWVLAGFLGGVLVGYLADQARERRFWNRMALWAFTRAPMGITPPTTAELHHPGEIWWWPTECEQCGDPIGPWSPDAVGSDMTHIVAGGGPNWEANRDHMSVATRGA